MAQISSGPSVARADALARGTLRLPDAIAISVSVLAPGMAMLLNVSGVAATSGGSTPLAFLLGGIACLALAFVVIGFTRRMASAGYAYTYASRSLGKGAGFMAGWLYFFGMICFVPMTMSGVGYLAADLLGLSPGWWIAFFFIGMALFLLLSVIRIRVTTRVQLYVGIATVVIILIVDAVTTAKGGSHGQAASAFTFGHSLRGGFSGVFYGIILGVTSYIGFETAADFGEETSNPRRYIPIAVIAATAFAVIFYLWTTYSITIGYGVNNGAKFAADPVALKTTATTFVGSWLGTLVEIGGMLSAFIVCVACATAASRTLFAMGREGVLPKALGHTSPRFKTPVNATIGVTVVATVMALLVGYPFSDSAFGEPFSNYYFWATTGTLVIIVVYMLLCIGGIVFFYRTRDSRRWNPLVHVLVPLIGAVVFGAALYGSVHPTPTGILAWTPWLSLAWLAVGVAILLWLRARRPEAVAQIGSILGEEGGADAEVLDASGSTAASPGLAVGVRGVADIPGLVAVVSVEQLRALALGGFPELERALARGFRVGLAAPAVVVEVLLAVHRIAADDHRARLRKPEQHRLVRRGVPGGQQDFQPGYSTPRWLARFVAGRRGRRGATEREGGDPSVDDSPQPALSRPPLHRHVRHFMNRP